ncbi:MAG: hypothetical protein P0Y53_21620 [Candidatus Pseudobacter hemicellulosilyticus]|uniref:Lipocalin-like domain-containing protein n=1 Tax=Candidatus Pseudobacter hemicellulosilyticus TaxID=3121375 RepID=A0AAJ5WR03_9BACT|nr:MAG: hypothetical protein P0Y53_21620 [Pseudobacter sp.]
MKLFALLLSCCFLFACSKKDEDKNALLNYDPLVGTWKLSEVRADPGDGSGTFLPTTIAATITFSENGEYTDSRTEAYTRYKMIGTDSIFLYHHEQAQASVLAIQQQTVYSLTYFVAGMYCGGPYGEKLVRVKQIIDDVK